MKEALYILGDLIHNLQRERGISAMLRCSEGKIFPNRLQLQYGATDKSFKILDEALERWGEAKSLKAQTLKKLRIILDKKDELSIFRSKLIDQKITASQSIDHYSHQLICPLILDSIEIALYMEGANPTFVSAFNAFLQWKERIGLERSIGVRGFLGYSFQNHEFVDRLLFLLSEQSNYQNIFFALATEKQKSIVQYVLDGDDCKKLDHLHDMLHECPEQEELSELTPEAWFDLITAKIDALQVVQYQLIDSLIEEAPEANTDQLRLSPSVCLKNAFTKHAMLIDSLQIFAGLPANTLNTLMSHAQIRDYQKGKLLFLEGEQAHRFYIILNGWVKIFKGTASGEEAILQMLSSGDSIMETAVYLNLTFPVSAQVAEDATILSLPGPVVREQVKSNNKLAVNLLSSMCYRSQSLIRQIEVARLKTVDERIGWFLLKLALDQPERSRQIQLPYDKSLIASYLDMKRETFSRALKRLKQKGFIIENDVIIMPEYTSLCEFCDHNIAENCPNHRSSNCPNPQELSEGKFKLA